MAMHAVADGHETPLKPSSLKLPTTFCVRHFVPSQRIASGPPYTLSPTAVHVLAVAHDTPVSPLVVFWPALPGVGSTVQLLPPQRIASGAVPGPWSLFPS